MIGITIKNKNAGFTLIELIVVLAVFLFVVGAAIGLFLSIIQNQRKVLAQQQLLSQVSYAEEYMSKALRMAKRDTQGSCLGASNIGSFYVITRGGAGIKFINASDNDVCQEIFMYTNSSGETTLKELRNSSNIAAATDLISAKGGLVSAIFYLGSTSSMQPRVTMLLKVKIPGDSQEPIRTMQTTVSERNLNIW